MTYSHAKFMRAKPLVTSMPASVASIALEDFKVGKLYWLAGQGVWRYQGPWGGDNYAPLTADHCLAFTEPRVPVHAPATGYSASAAQVLQEMSVDDIPDLREMRISAESRGLTHLVGNIDIVIAELLGEPHAQLPTE